MIAIANGKVVTVTGETYEKGTVLLDGGKIAEDGTYDELLAKKGYFYELVERQRLDK